MFPRTPGVLGNTWERSRVSVMNEFTASDGFIHTKNFEIDDFDIKMYFATRYHTLGRHLLASMQVMRSTSSLLDDQLLAVMRGSIQSWRVMRWHSQNGLAVGW